MEKITFTRFLPSVIVFITVVVTIIYLDRDFNRVQVQDARETVIADLGVTRTRLESRIASMVEKTRTLAASVLDDEPVDAAAFSRMIDLQFEEMPELMYVAWAPDLVVSFRHPPDGSERTVGQNYLDDPETRTRVHQMRQTGQMAVDGPRSTVGGEYALFVHFPIFERNSPDGGLRGILTAAFNIETLLENVEIALSSNRTQFALVRNDAFGGLEGMFFGRPETVQEDPIHSIVRLPNGTWTLYGTPAGGWEAALDGVLLNRLLLVCLGAFLIGPVLLANWLAVSRRDSIGQLERTEARLSAVIKNMPGAVFSYRMTDAAGAPTPGDRIDFIKPGCCEEVWGISSEAASANPRLLWDLATDPNLLEAFRTEIVRARAANEHWHLVWQIKTPRGELKWLEGRGHATDLPDGTAMWHNTTVDVTSEIRRQEEYERQKELTFQAQKNDSIGKLTGGVAHDFNNLLAVIMGNQELLRQEIVDRNVGEDLLELIDSSVRATERGADLTRKMLSFARRARLDPTVVDLNEIVRETGTWTARTLPETIRLAMSLDEGIPNVKVDRGSAESALLNLIVNARDAMPDGGTITVETGTVKVGADETMAIWEGLEPGEYVMLTLSDTGEGIPNDSLEKVFEPFFTTKAPGAGSGLGLSMVQGFMRQSGGTIQVYSEVGVGTTVKLLFRSFGERKPVKPADPANGGRLSQGGARLLLAEDEEPVRKVLGSILERAGYVVEEVSSGDRAFERFKADPSFDLLLTDIVMPGTLQGTGLAQASRMIRPDLPVVFMSGYASEAMVHGNGLRPEDIRLMKPVSRTDLLEAVARALAQVANQ